MLLIVCAFAIFQAFSMGPPLAPTSRIQRNQLKLIGQEAESRITALACNIFKVQSLTAMMTGEQPHTINPTS
jgi:hypothetical protein